MIKQTFGLFGRSHPPAISTIFRSIVNNKSDHKLLRKYTNVLYYSLSCTNFTGKSSHAIDNVSSEVSSEPANCHDDLKTKPRKKKSRKTKIQEYFSSEKHLESIFSAFPPEFSNHKKNLFHLYIVEDRVAGEIAASLRKYVPVSYDHIIEINPGPGVLTKKLLDYKYRLKLFEANEWFIPHLQKLQSKNSNIVDVINKDFPRMDRLSISDYHDGGKKMLNFLKNFEKKPWEADTRIVVLAVPNYRFVSTLVLDCYKRVGFPSRGRPELYCSIRPSLFRKFSATPFKDKPLYRSMSVLFQTAFDYEILNVLPREGFLPWSTAAKPSKKNSLLQKELKEEDNHMLFLVRITGKKNLYSKFDSQESLDLFVKFVRQFLKFINVPVIPILEKWYPNCGPKLIANGIGVFTHFADLTPGEVYTLFTICKRFPGFETSPFFTDTISYNFDEPSVTKEKKPLDRNEDNEEDDNEEDEDINHLL